MKKKKIIIGVVIVAVVIGFVLLQGIYKQDHTSHSTAEQSNIDYYTCGMHPSVRIAPEDYTEDTLCPICNMKLTPVYKEGVKQEEAYYGCGVDTDGECPHCDLGKADGECICGQHSFMIEGQKINCPVCSRPLRELTQGEADKLKGVVSRVKIKDEEMRLAGVQTQSVKKHHLYKEIRTVGKVAYDPGLAIAQEEFVSAVKTLDKMQEGDIAEIKERAENLVESSKRKLILLGLSPEQIEEMQNTREIQKSLILPEEKMWIYGDVYEYELSWIKQGEEAKITASSLPGEEFSGVISSINPVVNSKTRSIRFRAEVDNPNLRLKPGMYVDVVIQSMYMSPLGEHMVLAIPKEAVLDTGARKIIWIDKGTQEYEGRIVQVGPEAISVIDEKEVLVYPVLKGISEGERVVTKANFLIDSQSQISGVAASAYGGALGVEENKAAPAHQH